jgi:hypothetical protein
LSFCRHRRSLPEARRAPIEDASPVSRHHPSLRIFAGASALVLVAGALAGAPPASAAPAGESIRGRGIVAGAALYLFGEVRACGEAPSLPAAQIYVSTDEGATWVKRGPALTGSEILFARADGAALWAAGLHTAEGPAIDPFFLVPTPGPAPFAWNVRTIYQGPAELRSAWRDARDGLHAWLRPTDAHGERSQRAPLFYRSGDGGRSWSRDARSREGRPGPARELSPIAARSGRWRIEDRADGGFDVERLDAAGWRVIREFPWTACPGR